MDESVYRNLDTQSRMLADLEHALDAELDDKGDDAAGSAPVPFTHAMAYDEITVANDAARAERGWEEIDLTSALTPVQRERFLTYLESQRLSWTIEDFVALGFAGAVGVAATLFDTQLDRTVLSALKRLKETDLLKGWEGDGRRLPIDYTGLGVGGPSHRVKSAGHDLGRPLEALRQIREGVFRGTAWPHGVKTPVIEELPTWQAVNSWPEAMILWAKHLAADIVTPMSLPLPGFTRLYEMDNESVLKFAHAAYQGERPLGDGLNVRSGLLTPTLSVMSIEAILRTHMLLRAYRLRGTVQLNTAERAMQNELLLAGHGLVGAVALGKATATLLLTKRAGLAVRHLNLPVLMRVAALSLAASSDVRQRAAAAPSWNDLLLEWAQPWQLEAALNVEREAERLCEAGL